MKKSIVAKLIGSTVLLLLAIILGALSFVAWALVERAVAEDAEYVAMVSGLVHRIALGAGTLTLNPEALRAGIASLRSLEEQLLGQLARHRPGLFEPLLYPPEVRTEFDGLASRLTGAWQADLGRLLDAVSGGPEAGDAEAYAVLASAFVRGSLQILDLPGSFYTSLHDARQSFARPLLALFSLFTTLGAVGVLAYTLRIIFAFRRSIVLLLADAVGLPESRAPESGLSPNSEDEIGQLAARMRAMRTLEDTASLLRAAGGALAAESGRMSAGMARVAASVKSQAIVVDAAARACSGISASTRKIQEGAAAGLAAARDGSRAVERSIEKLARGAQTARALEERATRIEEAVALIADVADQTELVSLNAAIEAAREEEAGRGFTSVAQQVRKLADRSARAAAEMTDLVDAVLEGVRKVAADSGESLEAGSALKGDLERISGAIGTIAPLTHAAAEAAEKAGSSLGSAASSLAEATENANDVLAAHNSLRGQVSEIENVLQGFSRGGEPPKTTEKADQADREEDALTAVGHSRQKGKASAGAAGTAGAANPIEELESAEE